MLPAGDGHMLVFRHATRPRDEMKTWVDAGGREGVLEAARHPVYRTWEDSDGLLWLVGVDFASLQKDSPQWLTFRSAHRELAVLMPPDTSLGDLTADDLSRYLRDAT